MIKLVLVDLPITAEWTTGLDGGRRSPPTLLAVVVIVSFQIQWAGEPSQTRETYLRPDTFWQHWMCLSGGASQTERGRVRLWHLPECSTKEVEAQILALQKRNQSPTSSASVWLVSSVCFSDVLCRLVTLSWWLPSSLPVYFNFGPKPWVAEWWEEMKG